MFNSYSGFKSATKILHDAIKKTPKMGVAQLRETLVAATPIGNTAALKSHFSDSPAIAPAAPVQVAPAQIFVVVEKRNERLYSPAFSSYPEALEHIRTKLKNALDDADMLAYYYSHICKKSPANLDDVFEEVLVIIDGMNEAELIKFHAWFYMDESPFLQINQSSLTQSAPEETLDSKAEAVQNLLRFPKAIIARKLRELTIVDAVSSPLSDLKRKDGTYISEFEMERMLEDYANENSEGKVLKALAVEKCYSVCITSIDYDTDGADVDLPKALIFIYEESEVLEYAESAEPTQKELYDILTYMAAESVSDYTGFCFKSFHPLVQRCEGQTITTFHIDESDTPFVPVNDIITSIREEEWGDVRSYLDEFDTALKANTQAYIQIVQELDKQSHLVVFTRDGDSDWSYEEK